MMLGVLNVVDGLGKRRIEMFGLADGDREVFRRSSFERREGAYLIVAEVGANGGKGFEDKSVDGVIKGRGDRVAMERERGEARDFVR